MSGKGQKSVVKVYLQDNTYCSVPCTPETTVEDLWEAVAKKYGLHAESAVNFFVWAISSQLEILLYAESTLREVQEEWASLEGRYTERGAEAAKSPRPFTGGATMSFKTLGKAFTLKSRPSDDDANDIGSLSFKYVFRPASVVPLSFELNTNDREALHLLYLQAEYNVVHSLYPAEEHEALELAGLSMQFKLGDFDRRLHLPGFLGPREIPKYVPKHWLAKRSIADWEPRLFHEHQKHAGKSSSQIFQEYLGFVRIWPHYGCTFFEARAHGRSTYFQQSYEGLVSLGVNYYGFHVVDPALNKVVSFAYDKIVSWDTVQDHVHPAPNRFSITVIGTKEPEVTFWFHTRQAELVYDLLFDWTDALDANEAAATASASTSGKKSAVAFVNGDNDPQSAALDDFARHCYNSSSFVFQNWLVVKPSPCRRFGVTCANRHSDSVSVGGSAFYALDDQRVPNGVAITGLSLPGTGCNCNMEDVEAALRPLTNLTHLDLSHNQIHGTIPASVFGVSWPALSKLALQENALSGPLPSHLDVPPFRLRHLDLSQNFLSSTIPNWLADSSMALTDLLLNSNLLFGSVPGTGPNQQGQLGGGNSTSPLERLDLSANRLTGSIAFASQLSKLIQLSLAVNQFSGPLISVQPLPQLVVLDVSQNRLSGPVSPFLFEHPKLAVIFLSANDGLLFDTGSDIPPGLFFDDSAVLSFPTFSCPQLRPRHRYQVIDVPPSVSNFSRCTCNQGYHLAAPKAQKTFQCSQCPPHSLCPPGDNRLSPARGYYYEKIGSKAAFIPCPPISHNVTSCNPTNQVFDHDSPTSLQCAPGYQGRLCFECDDLYFKFGSVCEQCSPLTEFIAPVLLGLLLLFCFVYLWRVENLSLASTKIYIFYLQTVSLLAELNIPLPQAMLSFSRLAAVVNLAVPGFECMFHQTTMSRSMIRLVAVVSSPVIVGFVVVLFAACNYAVSAFRLRRRIWRQLLRDRTATEPDKLAARAWEARQLTLRKKIASKAIRVFVWFLWIAQLKISTNFFRLLACEPDAAEPDRSFLRFQPDLECTFSGPWGAQLILGSIAGLGISILLPLAVAIVLVLHRNDLQAVAPQLGQLFQMYRPRYFWWEFVLLARKLSLAFVVAQFGYQSLFLPLMIVLILAVSLSLQRSFKPFATRLENGLELFVLSVNLANYIITFLFLNPNLPTLDSQILGIGMTVINISVFLALSVTLVAQHSRRAWKWWRAKQKSLFDADRRSHRYHSLPFDPTSTASTITISSRSLLDDDDTDDVGGDVADNNIGGDEYPDSFHESSGDNSDDDVLSDSDQSGVYDSLRNIHSPRMLADVNKL